MSVPPIPPPLINFTKSKFNKDILYNKLYFMNRTNKQITTKEVEYKLWITLQKRFSLYVNL